jgi:endonuclease/exonuclease/phosphatase family metal-dependent hydrolase
MNLFKNILRGFGIFILILALALIGFLWFGNYHPAQAEQEPVACSGSAIPMLEAGQTLKALTWNVQTMSGKNYVFWSDLPNNDGPDEKPSPEDITATFEETVRVIRQENPDILLIQEIDDGAERTYYEDQMARLVEMLPEYPCVTSTFDWKSAFVPHPRILGSVGWKVAILSKYQISSAERIGLSIAKGDIISDQFKIKPAVLKAIFPMTNGGEFAAMTVHLDLYVPGTNTKDVQLAEIDQIIAGLDAARIPWLLGGDFNLLPADAASFTRLHPDQQKYYNPNSEIKYLFDRYQALPKHEDLTGSDFAKWLTRWPNDPAIPGPDRALDYFFVPHSILVGDYYVRMDDTLHISDHLPVIVEITIP